MVTWGLDYVGQVVLAILSLMLTSTSCQGALQCLCTTPECLQTQNVVCTTDSWCYVQYTPAGPHTQPPRPQLVRGCIDTQTPLLCENQRPDIYSGSWPVLLCCREHFCNKDTMPTLPPWAAVLEEAANKNLSLDTSSTVEDSNSQDTPEVIEHAAPSTWRTINPLYIGVPAAGACVLLAVIIFAVYILRRQHQMYEQEFYRSRVIKRPPSCRPPGHVARSTCPNGCRYVTMVPGHERSLKICHHACAAAYPDCDRSSNGSESRLLAPV